MQKAIKLYTVKQFQLEPHLVHYHPLWRDITSSNSYVGIWFIGDTLIYKINEVTNNLIQTGFNPLQGNYNINVSSV